MSLLLEWPAPAWVRPPAFGPWIEAWFSVWGDAPLGALFIQRLDLV
jgi:hypothetical protein